MQQDNSSSGHYEPVLTHTFLPGCPFCGGAHPLARKPAMPADTCPDCGNNAVAPGQSRTVKAVLIGYSPSTLMAKACFSIGKALSNLSKRI